MSLTVSKTLRADELSSSVNPYYEAAIRAEMRRQYPEADEASVQEAIDSAQILVRGGKVSITIREPVAPEDITVKIVAC